MPSPRRTRPAEPQQPPATECTIVIDGHPLIYLLRRSARRRKTLEMRFDGSLGLIVMAPRRTPTRDIESFLRRRARWILRTVKRAADTPDRSWLSGEAVLYRGRRLVLHVQQALVDKPAVALVGRSLRVSVPAHPATSAPAETVRSVLRQWFRTQAGEELKRRLPRWTKLLGRRPARVLVRDQRQRWGSCSRDGTLRFNWRLVMAPPELLDYVIVHELAHLAVPDHSASFWAEVARAVPDHKDQRRRLRELAPALSL